MVVPFTAGGPSRPSGPCTLYLVGGSPARRQCEAVKIIT